MVREKQPKVHIGQPIVASAGSADGPGGCGGGQRRARPAAASPDTPHGSVAPLDVDPATTCKYKRDGKSLHGTGKRPSLVASDRDQQRKRTNGERRIWSDGVELDQFVEGLGLRVGVLDHPKEVVEEDDLAADHGGRGGRAVAAPLHQNAEERVVDEPRADQIPPPGLAHVDRVQPEGDLLFLLALALLPLLLLFVHSRR
ncbi:uncharacterized protein LOC144704375 [Wolffia australiana]